MVLVRQIADDSLNSPNFPLPNIPTIRCSIKLRNAQSIICVGRYVGMDLSQG